MILGSSFYISIQDFIQDEFLETVTASGNNATFARKLFFRFSQFNLLLHQYHWVFDFSLVCLFTATSRTTSFIPLRLFKCVSFTLRCISSLAIIE